MADSITLYTMAGDDHSRKAKHLLQELAVQFSEKTVDGDENVANELVSHTGQWSVPALVVQQGDQKHIVVGYEPEAIKKIVGQ